MLPVLGLAVLGLFLSGCVGSLGDQRLASSPSQMSQSSLAPGSQQGVDIDRMGKRSVNALRQLLREARSKNPNPQKFQRILERYKRFNLHYLELVERSNRWKQAETQLSRYLTKHSSSLPTPQMKNRIRAVGYKYGLPEEYSEEWIDSYAQWGKIELLERIQGKGLAELWRKRIKSLTFPKEARLETTMSSVVPSPEFWTQVAKFVAKQAVKYAVKELASGQGEPVPPPDYPCTPDGNTCANALGTF